MPRKYVLKNPYYRNARISISDTQEIVYLFLKGVKASVAAQALEISEVTAHKIYAKLRKMLMSSKFRTDFSSVLDEHEYMLWTLFHVMRTFVYNVYDKSELQFEDDLGIDADMMEFLGLDALFGTGRFRVTFDQLLGCVRRCDSGTPPIIIQKMTKSGEFEEVVEKRLSCKTCPLKLLEHYKPSRNRVKYPSQNHPKDFVFEPYYKYKEDPRDLMILWIEVLGCLANYRNIPDAEMPSYIMQATMSRMLKRAEYKVKNVHYGMEIPSLVLEQEQLNQVQEGFSYQSVLDPFVLDVAMKCLKENPL